MTEPRKRKKLGELYFSLCKTLNDCFCGRSSYPFNTFSIYFIIAAAIALPIAMGQAYFQSGWHIAIEIIFILFYLGFLSCTILFYRKSIWHWCVAVILLVHYISLADVIIKNSSEFNILYLGFVGVYFISYASWKSANDVNRKGGLIDTIVLAIGIAGCVIGLIMLQKQVQYAKVVVIAGVALIYIYAIARSLFWLVYTQERKKLSLIKTMFYVVFYLVLIIGLPFFLLWTGVEESILQNVIIPIYASVLGGALALAGVAWTIRFTKNERVEQDKKRDEERREEERKKCIPYIKLCPYDKAKYCVDANFYKGIDLEQECEKIKDKTFYNVQIEDFTVKNISNTNVIMCGVIIDNLFYPFNHKLILEKGELCSVSTTKNFRVNLAKGVSKIALVVEDIFQNSYLVNCCFFSKVDTKIPYLISEINSVEYTGIIIDYYASDIELPTILVKETTNEQHSFRT